MSEAVNARDARQRYLLAPIANLVDQRVAALEQVTRTDIADLRRIIGEQGDAADDVAEVFGRTLTRLSAEVTALTEELARVRAALDAAGVDAPR